MRRLRLFCALLSGALWLVPVEAGALAEGDRAPEFRARSLTGDAQLSLGQYRGKVVYLDFWASWCAPCKKSLPLLKELQKEFGPAQFQVLAINVDQDLRKARELLAKHGISYPSASDPKGQLPETFEIQTMPTSFLIDRQGVIRHVHKGFREGDMDGLREKIRLLVAEKK